MNKLIHPFFETVSTLDSLWEKPTYPTAADPMWSTLFETGNELQKTNIARSWLWVFSREKQYHEQTRSRYITENFIEKNASWIKSIEPYLDASCFSKENLGDTALYLTYIFGKNKLEWGYHHDLWFGSPLAKLNILSQIDNDEKLRQSVRTDSLVHNRLWEALELPEATLKQHASVARLATEMGLFGHGSTSHIKEIHSKWCRLGYYGRHKTDEMSPYEIKQLEETHTFLQSQPPEVAKFVLIKLVRDVIHEDMPGNRYLYFISGQTKDSLTQENVYKALNSWLPLFEKDWLIGESLGMPIDDFMALQLVNDNKQNDSVLPNDLGINV